jgi:hypothetical protein
MINRSTGRVMVNSGRSKDHDDKQEQQQVLRQHRVTWRELAIRDHRLAQLKRRAELVRDNGVSPSFCASDHWYGKGAADGLRDRLAGLVGPLARADDPILGTDAALEVASATVRALLPPCRNCSCHRLDAMPDNRRLRRP